MIGSSAAATPSMPVGPEVPSLRDLYRLSATSQKTLLEIVRWKAEHGGVSPSVRDLMAKTFVDSTSVVNHHLEVLEDAGFIECPVAPGKKIRASRSIVVVGERWEPPDYLKVFIDGDLS